MQTIDHRLLGIQIIKQAAAYRRITFFQKTAFIWGNIEPDLNFFTFFRGVTEGHGLCGHSFEKNSIRIERLREKAECTQSGILKSYRLGKVMHYMADCFTFPHNDSFGGDLKAHMEYEHMLHRKLAAMLHITRAEDEFDRAEGDLWESFMEEHRKYLKSRRGEMDDIRFIIRAANKMTARICSSENSRKELRHSFHDKLYRISQAGL